MGTASNTLNGVNLVSFSNTPQAKGDTYDVAESTIEGSSGVLTLDVMSNDLGGGAKTLYSVDDGVIRSDDGSITAESTQTILKDLTVSDTGTVVNESENYTALGAKLAIVGGQVQVTMDGAYLAKVNALAAGESFTDTFVYAIRMANGTLSWAKASFTITGTNDVPVVAVADVTGGVDEMGTPAGDLTDTGTISFTDVDLTDAHTIGAITPSGGALGSLTATVTTDTTGTGTGGVVTWNYSVPASAVEYLADGQPKVETFTFSISDGHGGSIERTVSVTITGTNDVPVISLLSGDLASVALTETDAGLTASDTLTVRDADLSDTVTTTVTSVAVGGTYSNIGSLSNSALQAMMTIAAPTTVAADGGDLNNITWIFNSGAEAFNYLAAGETLQLTYTLTSSDGTATDTQDVVVTITGTADATVVSTSQITLDVTASPTGNSLPNGTLGLLSVTGGSGSYTYSLESLSATSLSGGVVTGFAGDLTIGSTGVVTATALDGNRIYYMTVNAQQGGTTLQETIRVITGTNADNALNGSATGDDVIFADNGGDIVLAGSGDDTVFGQQGADQIHGGDGKDVLIGGGGNDTFFFDSTANATTNVDHIKDFSNGGDDGTDTIWLSKTFFAGLATNGSEAGVTLSAADYTETASGGATAAMGSAHILYDQATGSLYYDADGGDATTGRVLFAVLDNKPALADMDNTDFKVGL